MPQDFISFGAFVRLGLFSFLPDLPPSYHPQAKRPAVRSSRLGGQRQRLTRRGSLGRTEQLPDTPHMIGQAEFHRRRHTESFVDPAPVVKSDVQGNCRLMGTELLGVGVGAPRTPTQVHPYGQVLPFNMVRGGLTEIRVPTHDRRHTARFLIEHHIVHIPTKRLGDGRLIGQVRVGHDLWPVQHTAPEIRHKARNVLSSALPNAIADDRLAVGIQCQPQIAVAVLRLMVVLEILLLRVDERPRFIELEAGDLEIAHPSMVQPMAGCPDCLRQSHNGRAMHAGQAGSGAE